MKIDKEVEKNAEELRRLRKIENEMRKYGL